MLESFLIKNLRCARPEESVFYRYTVMRVSNYYHGNDNYTGVFEKPSFQDFSQQVASINSI